LALLCLVGGAGTFFGETLRIAFPPDSDRLEVYREGLDEPLVTQNFRTDMRPYLHPVRPWDGNGVFTEIHPDHHPHQTGIYWGLKRLNGRDYFMKNGASHYRRHDVAVAAASGAAVSWRVSCDLLDDAGVAVFRETHHWKATGGDGVLVLDLTWEGEALTDVTVGQYFVGGLFVRMPWRPDIGSEVVNALGERNHAEAEGHRARWVDVGMAIAGRTDWGHIAILDHPANPAAPAPWRVDEQMGVGPSRQILGDWSLRAGEMTVERYRLVVHTGTLVPAQIDARWRAYSGEPAAPAGAGSANATTASP
jgi:hypothetical protein